MKPAVYDWSFVLPDIPQNLEYIHAYLSPFCFWKEIIINKYITAFMRRDITVYKISSNFYLFLLNSFTDGLQKLCLCHVKIQDWLFQVSLFSLFMNQ